MLARVLYLQLTEANVKRRLFGNYRGQLSIHGKTCHRECGCGHAVNHAERATLRSRVPESAGRSDPGHRSRRSGFSLTTRVTATETLLASQNSKNAHSVCLSSTMAYRLLRSIRPVVREESVVNQHPETCKFSKTPVRNSRERSDWSKNGWNHDLVS